MNNLQKLFLLILSSFCFGALQREVLARKWRHEGLELFEAKFPETKNFKGISLSNLNFWRGDIHVRLELPPFKARSWTVNRFTGQVIPWASENDPILTTLKGNKKGR